MTDHRPTPRCHHCTRRATERCTCGGWVCDVCEVCAGEKAYDESEG